MPVDDEVVSYTVSFSLQILCNTMISIHRCILLAATLLPLIGSGQDGESPLLDSYQEYLQAKENTPYHLQWIQVGPALNSARAESVQVDHTKPGTMYVAFGSGNLWKTEDHGINWQPIFEDQAAQGIGDMVLAPSNPAVIYVGTGESLRKQRNFTMPGTGVYRSDDGGDSWRHIGLEENWHTGEIAVHPNNPNIVFVAAMGKFWSPDAHKGIYRTDNGGDSWEHVLYVDENTRGNDVVIAPSDPGVVYASMWENNPDTTLFESVYGSKSSVYRSRDGGVHWIRVDNGLPVGPKKGRIGLAVSHSDPNKVYALIDNQNNERAKAAEVYKTNDGGDNWYKAHDDDLMIFSVIGWYFADIYVNPQNDEEIFALGVRLAHSTDGGKTFELVGGTVEHVRSSPAQTLHLDHCEMWINPENPEHLALGNDGGLYVSYDKGDSWRHYNNIPTGEFYQITTDNQTPYNIYGGVQDNATVFGPGSEWSQEFAGQWNYLWIDAWSGGDGCYTQVDPEDPNTIYFSMQNGAIRRMDMKEDTSIGIAARLPDAYPDDLNFNFVTPYIISPHNASTLYQAGNYVFASFDRGGNWEVISSDLGKSKYPEKQSMAAGALVESTISEGLLYMGTDHGAFWCTEDGGTTWVERSDGLANNYIRSICASRFDSNRVFAAQTGLNYDDLNAHLYISRNRGQSWHSIVGNLPNEPVNTIIEDPKLENTLYAGLMRGVYISNDLGQTWSLLSNSMPAVAVSDMVVQQSANDLIVSTHGRGIYKVNLDPIHALDGIAQDTNHLFPLPLAMLPKVRNSHHDYDRATITRVPITFRLVEDETVEISVMDEVDREIWSLELEAHRGLNQYRWDLITERNSNSLPYFIHYDTFIKPGRYRVFINVGDESLKAELVVVPYARQVE